MTDPIAAEWTLELSWEPDTQVLQDFRAFVDEVSSDDWKATNRGRNSWKDAATLEPIVGASRDGQAEHFRLTIDFYRHCRQSFDQVGWAQRPTEVNAQHQVDRLGSLLARKKLPFTQETVAAMAQVAAENLGFYPALLSVMEKCFKSGSLSLVDLGIRASLIELAEYNRPIDPKIALRFETLLNASSDAAPMPIGRFDAWTCALSDAIGWDLAAWQRLLTHFDSATSAKPSKRWMTTAGELIDTLGHDRHSGVLSAALAAVGSRSPVPMNVRTPMVPGGDDRMVDPRMATRLRGLIWSSLIGFEIGFEGRERLIAETAERSFAKLPGIGPVSSLAGNACLYALAASGSALAISQLDHLETVVKHPSSRKQIARARLTAANTLGITPEELADTSVPSMGFDRKDGKTGQLGDHIYRLKINGVKVDALWPGPDGRLRKTVPTAVKADFPEGLDTLKAERKQVTKVLRAQRSRLEILLRTQRSITGASWLANFAEHPIVGPLAETLIWVVDGQPGSWIDGAMVDIGDRPVKVKPGSEVVLWHPASYDTVVVEAWRSKMQKLRLAPPFKQTKREVYRCAAAEASSNRSERFAERSLRNKVLYGLCQDRGWTFRGAHRIEAKDVPTLVDDYCDLRIRFEVDHHPEFEGILTAMVEAQRASNGTPVDFGRLNPATFSEVMRDIDLFVSAGNIISPTEWKAIESAANERPI